MKRFTPLENVISLVIGILIAIPICIGAEQSRADKRMIRMQEELYKRQPVHYIIQPTEVEVPVPVPVVVHNLVYIVSDGDVQETKFTLEELDTLISLVHYEAGNQDDIGKRLVVDTVLNRLKSDDFPNTITDVIYQNAGGVYQYTVAGTGALDNGTRYCSEEERQLVYNELLDQLDDDVIFFQRYNFSSYGEPMYQHGDHYFSKMKEDA